MAKIYQFPQKPGFNCEEEFICNTVCGSPEYWHQLEHADEVWKKIQEETAAEEEICQLIQEGKIKIVIDDADKRTGHIERAGD